MISHHSIGNSFNFRRVENVGPKVSSELLNLVLLQLHYLAAMLILHMDKI